MSSENGRCPLQRLVSIYWKKRKKAAHPTARRAKRKLSHNFRESRSLSRKGRESRCELKLEAAKQIILYRPLERGVHQLSRSSGQTRAWRSVSLQRSGALVDETSVMGGRLAHNGSVSCASYIPSVWGGFETVLQTSEVWTVSA